MTFDVAIVADARALLAAYPTVPGVFACGDVARVAANVAIAVGDGAMAGTAAHASLIFQA